MILGKIPKKSGYLGMGIEYYTQKKWVFVYGYWVLYPKKVGIWVWVLGTIPISYPIPNTQKKTGYGCMIIYLKIRIIKTTPYIYLCTWR